MLPTALSFLRPFPRSPNSTRWRSASAPSVPSSTCCCCLASSFSPTRRPHSPASPQKSRRKRQDRLRREMLQRTPRRVSLWCFQSCWIARRVSLCFSKKLSALFALSTCSQNEPICISAQTLAGVWPAHRGGRGPGQTYVHRPHLQRQDADASGAAVVQSCYWGWHPPAALPRRLLPALRPREQVWHAHTPSCAVTAVEYSPNGKTYGGYFLIGTAAVIAVHLGCSLQGSPRQISCSHLTLLSFLFFYFIHKSLSLLGFTSRFFSVSPILRHISGHFL